MTDPYFDKEANGGIKHLMLALRFSLQGLKSVVQKETAFQQELLIALPVLASGYFIAESLAWFLFLLCSVLLVLATELLNSGIEAAVDRVGTEHHELAGLAKDYGSAAVMITMLIPCLIWFYMLYQLLNS